MIKLTNIKDSYHITFRTAIFNKENYAVTVLII